MFYQFRIERLICFQQRSDLHVKRIGLSEESTDKHDFCWHFVIVSTDVQILISSPLLTDSKFEMSLLKI